MMNWVEITAYIKLLLLFGTAIAIIILVNTRLNNSKIYTSKNTNKSHYLGNPDYANSFITRDNFDHSNSCRYDLGASCDVSDFDNSTCD